MEYAAALLAEQRMKVLQQVIDLQRLGNSILAQLRSFLEQTAGPAAPHHCSAHIAIIKCSPGVYLTIAAREKPTWHHCDVQGGHSRCHLDPHKVVEGIRHRNDLADSSPGQQNVIRCEVSDCATNTYIR